MSHTTFIMLILIVILTLCALSNEERYKSYERLQEELDLFLGWCNDTKNKLDNPPQVLT